MAVVNMLVEGLLDEAAAIRIIRHAQHEPGVCYGKKGCGYIKDRIQGFNRTAHSACYLSLVDFMDTRLTCPSEVISHWLPHRHPNMIFRLAVRELESWLLADQNNLADFLHVNPTLFPAEPEQLSDPKRELINLARRSRSSSLRSELVPEINSTAQVGRLYQSKMLDFIQLRWDISLAREKSPSLDRCIARLSEL